MIKLWGLAVTRWRLLQVYAVHIEADNKSISSKLPGFSLVVAESNTNFIILLWGKGKQGT